ncbi:amidohydrolase family protein [Rugosimonospora acidiphila]|uniref:amidohydrolase family protein n=1 Tax=Rugosimonospora acidiphila TaxID=556531 RepID=UPI0031E9F033
MIVDVHAHYYPQNYLESIGRPDLPPRPAAGLANQSLEERLELMDRAGVTAQVLSVSQAQPYLATAEDSAAAATIGNDEYAAVVEKYQGRFYAFGTLPMTSTDAAIAEVRRVFDDLNFVGVTLGCTVAGKQLDDPSFDPILAELHRREAVVFLHPQGESVPPGFEDFRLNWLIGAPIEDSATALRLIFSGVAEKYSNIQWIVPHFGGIIPLLHERIRRQTGNKLSALRSMWFDTVAGAGAESFACAAATLGADRLLYGTDYPYSPNNDEFVERLTYLDGLGLSEDELREIKGARVARLLKLDVAKHAR